MSSVGCILVSMIRGFPKVMVTLKGVVQVMSRGYRGVKIMVPLWVPIIIRPLIVRVPKKGP